MNTTASISQSETGQSYAVPIQIIRGDGDKGGLLGVILVALPVDAEPGSWLKDGGVAFISWIDGEPRRKIAVGVTVRDDTMTVSFRSAG
jgi:hypothetical protein